MLETIGKRWNMEKLCLTARKGTCRDFHISNEAALPNANFSA